MGVSHAHVRMDGARSGGSGHRLQRRLGRQTESNATGDGFQSHRRHRREGGRVQERTGGALYTTDGTGLRNDATLFGEVNPTYSTEFNFFSPTKTFAPVGSNLLDQLFQVAGQPTPAVVSGFGIVFSDVDLADKTTSQAFAQDGSSLGTFSAPVRSDAAGLSFVGILFENAIIARIRITLGTGALGATVNDITSGGAVDLVVLDNVIYGEPKEAF